MHHCIIAVKDDLEYLCILCIYEGKIDDTLATYYNNYESARELVRLGDINSIKENEVNAFHRDWGISWRYTRPQYYDDKQSLLEYCEATGLEQLFLYESDHWESLHFDHTFEYESISSLAS